MYSKLDYLYFSAFDPVVKEHEISKYILYFPDEKHCQGEGEISKFYENISYENYSGVVANRLDCYIVVNKVELQSYRCVHFPINTVYNPCY